MSGLDLELFDPTQDVSIDGMQLVDIPIDDISDEAAQEAALLIENLSKFYYDEDFMRNHPSFKKRVDTDLESLRILFKMRKSDEVAHDLLLNAIAGNSGNASLYRSLTEIQKTIISITTKICDIITGLNNLMKGYQLELNFDQDENIEEGSGEEKESTDVTRCRGSKDFIKKMNEE